jgi:hypothetical protein
MVAPFLAHRIWNREPFAATLEHCRDCEFSFFNPRMEPHEEARLYAGYRDPEYVTERHRFEPWYTPKFNSKVESPKFVGRRKELIRRVLIDEVGPVRSIVDFGGARGEVVHDLIPGATAYTYDISHVKPLPGVTACEDLADCRARNAELLLCSNVLEHVGFPQQHLEQMAQACGPDTRVWIEVPLEEPGGRKIRIMRIAQWGVLAITRPRIALQLLRPGLTNLFHEHVNYFTEKSLRALLERRGWQVSRLGTYLLTGYFGRGLMLWATATPPREKVPVEFAEAVAET